MTSIERQASIHDIGGTPTARLATPWRVRWQQGALMAAVLAAAVLLVVVLLLALPPLHASL